MEDVRRQKIKQEEEERRRKVMLRAAQKKREMRAFEENEYEMDDFVVDDDLELTDEVRRMLDKITNKKKIRELARRNDNIVIRESNFGEINREEHVSRVEGLKEDKFEFAKIKQEQRKKRKGFAVDSDEEDAETGGSEKGKIDKHSIEIEDLDVDEEDEEDEEEDDDDDEEEDDDDIDGELDSFIVSGED